MPARYSTTCGELFDVGDDSCSASKSSVEDSASTDETLPAADHRHAAAVLADQAHGLNTSL
jgi:hypothetical protein